MRRSVWLARRVRPVHNRPSQARAAMPEEACEPPLSLLLALRYDPMRRLAAAQEPRLESEPAPSHWPNWESRWTRRVRLYQPDCQPVCAILLAVRAIAVAPVMRPDCSEGARPMPHRVRRSGSSGPVAVADCVVPATLAARPVFAPVAAARAHAFVIAPVAALRETRRVRDRIAARRELPDLAPLLTEGHGAYLVTALAVGLECVQWVLHCVRALVFAIGLGGYDRALAVPLGPTQAHGHGSDPDGHDSPCPGVPMAPVALHVPGVSERSTAAVVPAQAGPVLPGGRRAALCQPKDLPSAGRGGDDGGGRAVLHQGLHGQFAARSDSTGRHGGSRWCSDRRLARSRSAVSTAMSRPAGGRAAACCLPNALRWR